MALLSYKDLFDKAVRVRLGVVENLEIIEARVAHLRKGGQLEYQDLLAIADDSLWPFSSFWSWPNRYQIEQKLEETKVLLSQLRHTPGDEGEIIQKLFNIFKNIGLVSIILRFVHPEHYGIHSLPVLETAKSKRGKNEVEDYINYLNVLRTILETKEMRERYGLRRAADVDMLLFAISQLGEKYHLEFNAFYAKYYAPCKVYLIEISNDFQSRIDKFDKILKGRILEAIIHLSKNPFFAVGDTVKPLTQDRKGEWRYRIGDYRLIYVPNREGHIVRIVAFGPRGGIYS